MNILNLLSNKRFIYWVAIVWTIIMLIGCLTPHEDLPDTLTTWNDKFMHIAIFAGFGLLWILAGNGVLGVLVAGLLYGGLIEVLQAMLPINRTGDFWDAVGDVVGTLIGIGLARLVQKLINAPGSSQM